MDSETEVIKHKMAETHKDLSDKLNVLEEQVASTVKETSQTVSQTVEAVKETVESTVHTVAESIQAVKETFDLNAQMEKHPWLVLGGCVALGYALGSVLPSASGERRERSDWSGYAFDQEQRGRHPVQPGQPAWSPPPQAEPRPPEPPREETAFSKTWGPLLDKLKGLAVGVATGVAGEVLLKSVPEGLKDQLGELVDNFTRSLGGTVMRSKMPEPTRPPVA